MAELSFECPQCEKLLLVYVPSMNLATGKLPDPTRQEEERRKAEISALQLGYLFVDSTTDDRCPSCRAVLDSEGVEARFEFNILTGNVKETTPPNGFWDNDTNDAGNGGDLVLH